MIADTPISTVTFNLANDFRPESPCVYVHGVFAEERSAHLQPWHDEASGVDWFEVTMESRDRITVRTVDGDKEIWLQSLSQLVALCNSFGDKAVYLDITGLRHGTWAGLLRGLKQTKHLVRVVYVEPCDYRMSPRPTENEHFDLSERIEGISPLPGFENLQRSGSGGVFVPLLGFEGNRLQYLINQEEPIDQLIFPIIGVPGFMPGYPFTTMWTNRKVLREKQAWRKMRYAAADCPFSALGVIRQLHEEHSSEFIRLAPIGTKPHALGAVLYALMNPSRTEIVYDHPVRRVSRTVGVARLHVYEIAMALQQ